MTTCATVRRALHAAAPQDAAPRAATPDLAEHLAGCAGCAAVAAAYARLDGLLATLPTPPPPAGLGGRVLQAVAARRRADARWARAQALVLVAASVLVVGGVALPAGGVGAASGWPDALRAAWDDALTGPVAEALGAWAGLGASAEAGLAEGLGLLPSPPVAMLLALAPLLLVANWALCRGVTRPEVA